MNIPVQQLDLPLNRDNFLRQLLHHLTGTLQDVVGLKQAEGFVAMVAQRIGEELNHDYRSALGSKKLGSVDVSAVAAT